MEGLLAVCFFTLFRALQGLLLRIAEKGLLILDIWLYSRVVSQRSLSQRNHWGVAC